MTDCIRVKVSIKPNATSCDAPKNTNNCSRNTMSKFKKFKGNANSGYSSDDNASNTGRVIRNDRSDAVSELSHDESSVGSKSSTFKNRFFGGKKKSKTSSLNTDDTRSMGSSSKNNNRRIATSGGGGPTTQRSVAGIGVAGRGNANKSSSLTAQSPSDTNTVRSGGTSRSRRSAGAAGGGATDTKRLTKDAKSRYNIGLVYLKTGDYAKAQENLEHSLYCHIQLSGHDAKLYSNESLFNIASVREKLGDCYFANTAIVDKCLAFDHYDESKRLLKSVDPEDAPENVVEMLERVEEKLKSPELCASASMRKRPPPPVVEWGAGRQHGGPPQRGYGSSGSSTGGGAGYRRNYGTATITTTAAATSRGGEDSSLKGKAGKFVGAGTAAGVGAGVGAAAAAGASTGSGASTHNKLGIGKLGKFGRGVIGFATDLIDDIDDGFDKLGNKIRGEDQETMMRSVHEDDQAAKFEVALVHLDRNNHRTALNHLSSLQKSGVMKDEEFRSLLVEYMMKVASSAMEDNKIGVATDAYEEAFAVLNQEEDPGRCLDLARRGCIKGHKLLAMEEERDQDYETAIQHRYRVYQLLDMANLCIPACQQLIMVAYCYGQMGNYDQSADTLSDAIRRVFKGVQSMEYMPKNRLPILIKCYHMRAVCYAKLKKWRDAFDQYDEVLPLIAREEGIFTGAYNSVLIHKAALLVTTGRHAEAIDALKKYLTLSEEKGNDLQIDESDHILALDTYAAAQLKVGNIDKAIATFEMKLAIAKKMQKSDEIRGETMHKLGCLYAYKKRHNEALPMLTQALDTRKFLYNGNSKFLFETTWAVAATSHAMGEKDIALKEYGTLLEKMHKIDGSPIDSAVIQNSAGKLYFEEGKLDQSIKSFREALKAVESSGNDLLKANIMLNMANAMMARCDFDKAIALYDDLAEKPSLRGSKEHYLALFNKSLLLLKKGDNEEAKLILGELTSRRSSVTPDVKGGVYLTLGNISVSEGNIPEALEFFDMSLGMLSEKKMEDLNSIVKAKKSIAMTYFETGEYDASIDKLEEVLGDLSKPGLEKKQVNILKAEIWSSMSRVYHKKDDLASAKNFSKLGEHCDRIVSCAACIDDC